MSTIPLPALDVKPPAPQPGPLEQYGQLMAIRNAQQEQQLREQQMQTGAIQQQGAQQENQMRALQLQDQQNLRSAAKDIDWSQSDAFDKFLTGAQKSGVSPQTLSQLSMQRQQYLKSVADTDVATNTANLANNNTLLGHIETLEGVTEPTKRAAASQTIGQQILSEGSTKNPQILQTAQAMANGQLVPTDDQLDAFKAGLLDHKTVLSNALNASEVGKNKAQQAESEARTNQIQQEMALGTGPMADSRYRNILMNQKLGRPVSAEDLAFKAAYEKQKTLVPVANFNLQNGGVGGTNSQPSVIAKGLADGSVKWNDIVTARTPLKIKEGLLAEVKAINPNFNSGDFTVEQKQREAFTSGSYSQQLTAINTAREHMKTFTSAADALDNGNVQALNNLGNTLGLQFGSDKATNFNIVKQAFSSEVGKAFAGASVAEGDRQELANQINAANSPAQLRGAAEMADKLLAGKQTALKQTYDQGQGAKPNFGESQGGSTTDQNAPKFGDIKTFPNGRKGKWDGTGWVAQ